MTKLKYEPKNLLDSFCAQKLVEHQFTWCITGVAGFIGSHLLETLLSHGQKVIGVDNFIASDLSNLNEVQSSLTKEQWERFTFIESDVCHLKANHPSLKKVDFILHHAALGSVPGSIDEPELYHKNNVEGFLNVLELAKKLCVRKLIYASSSAVYGENNLTMQKEGYTGTLLSPYAATKITNEAYAQTWHSCYNLPIVGFRYFNIFGSRQDPTGSYAAVIPKWIQCLINKEQIEIYGNGLQVRDFCHVQNVVFANVKACLTNNPRLEGQVFNLSAGEPINLNSLAQLVIKKLSHSLELSDLSEAIYGDARPGDICNSQADTSKITQELGYAPLINLEVGLEEVINWFLMQTNRSPKSKVKFEYTLQ